MAIMLDVSDYSASLYLCYSIIVVILQQATSCTRGEAPVGSLLPDYARMAGG